MIVSVDFETRSPVDLKTCGAFVYFDDPDAKVLMAAYRIDDGPLKCWTYDQPPPLDLWEAIRAGATIKAWNAQFETLGFDMLARRHGWPQPRYDQYVDTAAAAAAMALPRALGDLGAALGLDVQKDKEGMRLIRKFSIPRKPKGVEPPGLYWHEPEDHPEDFARFVEYCKRDVETEEAAAKRLMPLSDYEQQIWLLDQKINRRGIRIDRASAQAALRLAAKAKLQLDREMRLATAGYVPACSQPGKLVEWVEAQGATMTSAAKAEITDLLEADDLPANVRKALEIRQEAAKTSVAKLQAMLNRASADGRVRGTFMYAGAGTGRWVNTGVNFANLPRPRKLFETAKEEGHLRIDALFQAIRTGEPDALREFYGDDLGRPLHLVSDAIRGFLWAAPGKDLVQADYSNIEGNVVAWLAGEDWKLEAIRELNADPSLPDMYRRTAAAILGLTTEIVTKKHWARQAVGKPAELGLSYGGGVMAFVTFAQGYGVKLEPLAPAILEQADAERLGRATKRYEACMKRKEHSTEVLSRDAWIACEVVKLGWRAANSAIAAYWGELENAAREAVQTPGVVVEAGKARFLVAKGFLWMQLPSGRCLAYGSPKLKDQVWAKRRIDGELVEAEVMDRDLAEALERKGEARIEGPTKSKVTALGVNSVTKKWERFGLYGGLLCENVTQATARDILVNGMLKAEAASYEIIAHVYDEIITEVPRGFGDVGEFERLICELPDWAAGLPLMAGGFRAKRYKKD